MTLDILLTGADGQVGWEITRRAAGANASVQALTRADLDITDSKAVHRVIAAAAPRLVINAAAYTAVDKAEAEKDIAFAVNRDGPAHIAAVCAARSVPLIHISTDYVFDGRKNTPYVEEDATEPLGVYGESKLAGECAVRAFLDRHVIVRSSWIYGVHGHNFVKTMLRLSEERRILRVVDDQRGCPTFAGDLADALLALARRLTQENLPDQAYGTFHCAGEGVATWCEFAKRIFGIAEPTLKRVPDVKAITTAEYPTPARRPANSALNSAKLERIHGIKLRPWEDALTDMLGETLSDAPAQTQE